MNKKILKSIIIILIIILTLTISNIIYGSEPAFRIGDINGDGFIDSIDTLRIIKHIAASTIYDIYQDHPEWILKDLQFKCGDINEDGIIDSRDTLRELEYIAAKTIPSIEQDHPNWITYIESKWIEEATELILDKTNIKVEEGNSVKLSTTIIPSTANNQIIEWSSSDITIATVDEFGTITGKTKGTAVITAKLSNSIQKTCIVEVIDKTPDVIPAPSPIDTTKDITNTTISLSTNVLVYNGNEQAPSVTIIDGNKTLTSGTDYILSYENNRNIGTGKITITGIGNYTGIVYKNFSIIKANYDTSKIKFEDLSVTYDGEKHSIIATGVPSGVTVTYIGNEQIKPGKYDVLAQFTGINSNYDKIPDKHATLTINKRSITGAAISGISDKTYTGKAITQNITIKLNNKTLIKNAEYKVEYKDNIKIGKATTIITGIGDYEGTITKQFNINGIAAKSIALKQIDRTIAVGTSLQLNATITPSNTSNNIITWSSSNNNIATVSKSGLVKGIKPGKVTVTAKTSNGLTATCIIRVNIPAQSISLNYKKMTVDIGATKELKVYFNPTNTTSKTITWSSSNSDIVSVYNGVIKAKKYGKATITAKSTYGKTATCTVNVEKPQISVITLKLNKNRLFLTENSFATLKANINPINATDQKVTWSTSNSNIVSVFNGSLIAKKAGTATITAQTSNGKKDTCVVTVNSATISVITLTLNKNKLELTKGKSETLSASINPINATNKIVIWNSSNTNVATVSNGKVTAKGVGTATITAKASNGKIATCVVKVVNPTNPIPVSSVLIKEYSISIKAGESRKLTATVEPNNATNKSLYWSTLANDNNIISVGQDGTVRAYKGKTGIAIVKARSMYDSSKYDLCVVHVVK